jgi:hypothetical protein
MSTLCVTNWRGAVCTHARVLLAMLLTLPAPSVALADFRYSPARGPTCVRAAHGHEIRCPGPAGYVEFIIRRELVIRINYGRAAFMRPNHELLSSDLLWRGDAALLDDRIEWHLRHGRLFAAIVKIFTLAYDDRPLQQFLIAKVTRSGSCEIGRIDASDRYAVDVARIIAGSRSAMIECD